MIRPKARCIPALALSSIIGLSHAQAPSAGKLQVYFVDVEGGQATLFVTPAHQSLLIDTGWPGNNGRDADRIVAAAHRAGLIRLDYVLITHYHDDHVGGVPQLIQRIPVGTFIDHGPNREFDHGVTEHGYAAYQAVLSQPAATSQPASQPASTPAAKGTGKPKLTTALKSTFKAPPAKPAFTPTFKSPARRMEAHPGDVLPIEGMHATVISADGNTITQPLPGAGQPNSFCTSTAPPADQTENARSLGIEINFGRLRLLDLGDLTADKEHQLMCPTNRLGKIDVLIVSHHGWYQSSSPALVDAIAPRIAIMDNGARKGGSVPVLDTIAHAPGLETLWQLHYSEEGGDAHNTKPEYIANPQGEDAHTLRLTGSRDGSFDVFNDRTNATKHYPAQGTAATHASR